jgi:hypothetical protein
MNATDAPPELLLFADAIPLHRGPDLDFHSYMTEFFADSHAAPLLRNFFAKTKMLDLVLCSGTTMGTGRAIRSYLQGMVKLFKELNYFPEKSKGIDQGYHNWYL